MPKPSPAQNQPSIPGPTMAVIARNCPDIEVVVVDINEGERTCLPSQRAVAGPAPPSSHRPSSPATAPKLTPKKHRAHQSLELRRAPHLRARPRRRRARLPRAQPVLQHRHHKARRRSRHCFCFRQHPHKNERHRRGAGGRPDLLGGRSEADCERGDVEQDRGGEVDGARENGRGDRQGLEAQLRGGG